MVVDTSNKQQGGERICQMKRAAAELSVSFIDNANYVA